MLKMVLVMTMPKHVAVMLLAMLKDTRSASLLMPSADVPHYSCSAIPYAPSCTHVPSPVAHFNRPSTHPPLAHPPLSLRRCRSILSRSSAGRRAGARNLASHTPQISRHPSHATRHSCPAGAAEPVRRRIQTVRLLHTTATALLLQPPLILWQLLRSNALIHALRQTAVPFFIAFPFGPQQGQIGSSERLMPLRFA